MSLPVQRRAIVIPTSWVRADLDPTKPIASVQLCDVALRVSTFAKHSYGDAVGPTPTQTFSMRDNGIHDQIDPLVSRVRPVFDGSTFADAGPEHESLVTAVHVPKNTTRAASSHQVRSPVGGPGYLANATTNYRAHDPGYGVQDMACSDNPWLESGDNSRARNALACRAWADARANNELLAQLSPTARINGRFAGIVAVGHAAMERAGGVLTFDVADADDGGAFAANWERGSGGNLKDRIAVSDFYDDAVPFPLTPLSGALSVARDGNGRPIVRVVTHEVGASTFVISSALE